MNVKVNKIKPTKGRMLIKPAAEVERKTEAGIIIPKTEEDHQPFLAEVIAIGNPQEGEDIVEVKVGDTILCGKFAGIKILTEEENKYAMISQMEALAIIED